MLKMDDGHDVQTNDHAVNDFQKVLQDTEEEIQILREICSAS